MEIGALGALGAPHPDVTTAAPPGFAAFTRLDSDHELTVVLRGDLEAATVPALAAIMESAVRLGGPHLRIDLTDVTDWSLLVEAMLLSTAHDLQRAGGRLVLGNPSAGLRAAGTRLDLFSRIATDGEE